MHCSCRTTYEMPWGQWKRLRSVTVSSATFNIPLCLELTWASKRVQNPTSARPHEKADLCPRHDAQHGKLLPYHKKAYFILPTKWGGGGMEELANVLMHKTTTSALVELRHPTETELTWIGNIFPYKQMNIHQVIMNQAAVKRRSQCKTTLR